VEIARRVLVPKVIRSDSRYLDVAEPATPQPGREPGDKPGEKPRRKQGSANA